MEVDEQDGSLVLAIFKKKSSAKKNKKTPNTQRPSTPETLETEEPIQEGGNTVISSRISKKSTPLSNKSTPSKPKHSRISLGSTTDKSPDTSIASSKLSARRKLARPESQTSLINPVLDDESVYGSPLSQQSSRPTYSTAHLQELKSLSLSTSSYQSTKDKLDELTRAKFAGHHALEEDDDLGDFGVTNQPISAVQIPSSTFINSAKESRSQARKIGLSSSQLRINELDSMSSQPSSAEDFISLSSISKPSSSMIPLGATKNGDSRLVREEDQFGEGDDEFSEFTGAKERVPLGERAGLAAEANKKADMEAMLWDAGEDLLEGSREELEWEAAQIRRGGIGNRGEKTTTERKPEIYQPASIPEHTTLTSLESLESRSLNILHLLEQSLAEQTEAALQFTAQEENLSRQESELRQEVTREAQQLEFFEELEKFIKEVNLFFKSKFPKLEKIEQDLLSILKERAELIFKRRYEDLSDDLVLFKQGQIGVTRPTRQNPKTSTDLQNGRSVQETSEELDELGRTRPELDISPHAPSRTSRRSDRSQRRKRRTARVVIEKMSEEDGDEGFSTDDSLSPADSSDLLSASQSLLDSGKQILVDITNPVFLSPTHQGSISDRFLSWKSKYPEQYENAFGNLALVQAWEFWIRIEMVTGLNLWGLQDWVGTDDKRGIENWEWMRSLEQYDHVIQTENQTDGRPTNQESVIAATISTVVIPFLLPIIKSSYDPFSVKSTSKSLQLAEQISYVLDTQNNPTYDQLIKGFLGRFRSSIYELKHLLGSSTGELKSSLRSQIGVEGIHARKRFLLKSFKLFQQGIRWKDFFHKNYWIGTNDDDQDDDADLLVYSHPQHPFDFKYLLINNLLVQIIFPILFISWETGGRSVSEQILKICPKDFLPDEIESCLRNGHDLTAK